MHSSLPRCQPWVARLSARFSGAGRRQVHSAQHMLLILLEMHASRIQSSTTSCLKATLPPRFERRQVPRPTTSAPCKTSRPRTPWWSSSSC